MAALAGFFEHLLPRGERTSRPLCHAYLPPSTTEATPRADQLKDTSPSTCSHCHGPSTSALELAPSRPYAWRSTTSTARRASRRRMPARSASWPRRSGSRSCLTSARTSLLARAATPCRVAVALPQAIRCHRVDAGPRLPAEVCANLYFMLMRACMHACLPFGEIALPYLPSSSPR